jgi:uncharacterized protein (DUF302 family)
MAGFPMGPLIGRVYAHRQPEPPVQTMRFADMNQIVDPYERIGVESRPELVVAALHTVLRRRGVTEYAVVDHGRDMAEVGAPGHRAWTLVFGNPAAGAKLLEEDPAAAVDIPLRVAVIAAGAGSAEIVLRDMRTLLSEELSAVAQQFTETVRALALEARDLAESG